jgi:predicted amidohydrolase/GNAT superfamily N-acetyltransferase
MPDPETDEPSSPRKSDGKRPKIGLRRAREEDVPAIYACQKAAYPGLPETGLCDERQLRMQLVAFPEGQLVATSRGKIVGYATSLILQLEDDSPWYSYSEVTGNGSFSTHDPSGDTLYGADIAVHPDWRGRGVAARLYEGRKKLMRRLNLRRMVAGGRIPGFREHAGRLSAEEYVEAVVAGELKDPALNAHLKAGYEVRGIHMGYVRDDRSLDYATYLEMTNEAYRPKRRTIAASPLKRTARRVRVCASQYRMRRVSSWEDFRMQVEFFVETAEQYACHFLLLPELFTAQLFSMFERGMTGVQAIAELADMTPQYLDMFTDMARKHGLYIIAGTHPVRTEGVICNVAHLFTPNGEIHTQEKLHVTPNEREEYGIRPGENLRVFDTPYGRIAIVICYDIEFPELVRVLTMAGAEVVFVPFSTDERKAYLRVRYCAQARAVENMVYVALSGNVGNLPQVENFLINYGEALICTPSDFAFPPDGIAAKADPNAETVVISDLDLGALEQAREMGSVRPLRDRRPDLYRLESVSEVEIVRVF